MSLELNVCQFSILKSKINTLTKEIEKSEGVFKNPDIKYSEYPFDLNSCRESTAHVLKSIVNSEMEQIEQTINLFKNQTEPALINSIDLLQTEQNHLNLKKIFNHFKLSILENLDDPHRLINKIDATCIQMIGLSNLSFCNCCPNVDYRTRVNFSSALINYAFWDLKPGIEKSSNLMICSIGSGCCLQEVMTHAALIKEGYLPSWILVDPAYKHTDDVTFQSTSSFTFQKLIQAFWPNTRISIEAISINDYLDKLNLDINELIPDVFMIVDVNSNEFSKESIKKRMPRRVTHQGQQLPLICELNPKTGMSW